ncbi:predicted protein [Lichtheimia corymbifera JMRC:FSU:9682]|uniref:Uncharacterized protein n=1 Tax=Lichtheimia corymbifera JMRC:FSU:9682 TaxID=1263082 RepID=A0A068RUB4_9FUNG|nr:predicted protein [Lichtheimia corymbifera JMRC:FSU:9682]
MVPPSTRVPCAHFKIMAENHFQNSFDHKVRNKLYVKEFWSTEPCDWTITNYLCKLIAQDPAVTRRGASNRLINDATIIKKHVVAGTVAETMANAMASYTQHSRGKETFNAFFNNHAGQMSQETLKYGVQKTRLRSAMAEQVVNEEEKENARKRPMDGSDGEEGGSSRRVKTSKRKEMVVVDDNQISEQGNDNDGDDDDTKSSFWEEWKQFLIDPENNRCFMQLSPESHNVIWCGKLVRRRSCLPHELYERLNQEVPLITMHEISPNLVEMSMAIFDAKEKLIVDICRTLSDDVYDNCGPRVLEISESCYRSYLFDNCLKAAARYLRNINHNVTFFPGEIELNAMTLQLKQEGMNDRRYKYNADALSESTTSLPPKSF